MRRSSGCQERRARLPSASRVVREPRITESVIACRALRSGFGTGHKRRASTAVESIPASTTSTLFEASRRNDVSVTRQSTDQAVTAGYAAAAYPTIEFFISARPPLEDRRNLRARLTRTHELIGRCVASMLRTRSHYRIIEIGRLLVRCTMNQLQPIEYDLQKLEQDLIGLMQLMSDRRQREIGWIEQSHSLVSYQDAQITAEVRESTRNLSSALCVLHFVVAIEAYFPNSYVDSGGLQRNLCDECQQHGWLWSSELDLLRAYRHVRHSFAHNPDGTHANTNKAPFDRVMASSNPLPAISSDGSKISGIRLAGDATASGGGEPRGPSDAVPAATW